MTELFLCGPYGDRDLIAAVTGGDISEPRRAVVPDHALAAAPGGALPPIVARDGAVLEGWLATPGAAGAARLAYHAACHGGTADAVAAGPAEAGARARARSALAYGGVGDGADATGDLWDAGDWTRRWAPIWRIAADEVLSYRGHRQAQDVAGLMRVIQGRAASRWQAMNLDRPGPSGLDMGDVTIEAFRRPYSAFFAMEEYRFRHARFDGSEHPPVERAVFVAADAVTVLPYDVARDRVLLVEQIRAGPLARGERSPWVLEPVAGRIEPGDTAEATARKEAHEEAGLELYDLIHIADTYPSTGCMSEYVHAYLGLADLPDEASGLGGLASEGEDIRAHILPRAELMAAVAANRMPDMPLVMTAWWLQANLDRIRRRH